MSNDSCIFFLADYRQLVIQIVCATLILLGICVILLLVVYCYRKHSNMFNGRHQPCPLNQKANNTVTEPVMKRYKNVLSERDKKSHMKRSSIELIEINVDLQKYGKNSLERQLSDEYMNDSTKNKHVPKKANVKYFNVEISKSNCLKLDM